MRLISFQHQGRAGFGVWTEQGIVDLAVREGIDVLDLAGLIERYDTPTLSELVDDTDEFIDANSVTLDLPIPNPNRIICVGINYHNRPGEYGTDKKPPKYPSLFLRAASSLAPHNANLLRPPESPQLDYEGEIAIVIGRAGRRIAVDKAMDHIAGYSCFNEGTIRDWVRHGVYNVTAGKNWYHSGAFGPWLTSADEVADPSNISIETLVNGERVQFDTTANLIVSFAELIAYISTFTPLSPGDVIATGTPVGAGGKLNPPRYLLPGDKVEIRVSTVGVLSNSVVDEQVG